jgi:hypothetical protein
MTAEEKLKILEQRELERKIKRNEINQKAKNKKAAKELGITLDEYLAQYDKIQLDSKSNRIKKRADALGISTEAYQLSKLAERLGMKIEDLKNFK